MKTKKTFKKSEHTDFLGKVYKDIYAIKITDKDSLKTILKRFYDVMEKYGICQGNWSESGRIINNPEWCICWNVFRALVDSKFMFMGLMSDPPKQLLAYEKEPKRTK